MGMISDEEARLEGLRTSTRATYQDRINERNTELSQAYLSFGSGSEAWRLWASTRSDAADRCNAIFGRLQRGTDGFHIPITLSILGALFIAALEAPLNKFMLDNVLNGNNVDSYAVSMFITLCVIGLAHIAGSKARHIYSGFQKKLYVNNIVVALAIVFLMITPAVMGLTVARAAYDVAATDTNTNFFRDVTEQVLQVGLWNAFKEAMLNKNAQILVTLNSLGIGTAFFLAYISQDSDPVYDSALQSLRRSTAKLHKMINKYNKMRAAIWREYTPQLSTIAATYASQNARIIELKRLRGEALSDDDRLDLTKLDPVGAAESDEAIKTASPLAKPETADPARLVTAMSTRERKQS